MSIYSTLLNNKNQKQINEIKNKWGRSNLSKVRPLFTLFNKGKRDLKEPEQHKTNLFSKRDYIEML